MVMRKQKKVTEVRKRRGRMRRGKEIQTMMKRREKRTGEGLRKRRERGRRKRTRGQAMGGGVLCVGGERRKRRWKTLMVK